MTVGPRPRAGLALAAALALAGCAAPEPSRPITLLVRPGRFASAEAAAAAADSIDWWDADTADDDACSESDVALDLARFLPRALGLDPSEVQIRADSALPAQGDVIVLGNRRSNPLLASLGVAAPASPNDEAFRLSSRTREARRVVVIEGVTRRGTRLGAYTLLERLGVRFYDLADSMTVFPNPPSRLPQRLDLEAAPAFRTRGFWAWEPRGNAELFRWISRNRLNLWTAAEPHSGRLARLGFRLTGGGHMIESLFLDPLAPVGGTTRVSGAGTRFQAHPEWFGLENGSRHPGIELESGLNFCTSNAAAVDELARGLVEDLRAGSMRNVDLVSFWPLDAGRWCQCAACAAQGSPTDRWLAVTARVAEALEAARRDGRLPRPVTLLPPAYLETSQPPTRPAPASLEHANIALVYFPYFRCYAHALADPECPELNRPLFERLLAWAEAGGRPYRGPIGIGEYYNVSWTKSLPRVVPHVMAADLVEYAKLGARDFSYMHAPSRRWGTWTLNHALLARLLWSPGLDVDSLLDDYMRREHPSAPREMRTFYSALERGTANLEALQFTVGSIGSGNNQRLLDTRVPIFQIKHMPGTRVVGPNSAPGLPEIAESFGRAERALAAARARGGSPAERARLDEIAERFDYGDAMVRFWISLIRAAEGIRRSDGDTVRAELAIADIQAARLRKVTDLVQVSASHANAANGLEASGATRMYERMSAILRSALAR